MRFLGSGGRDVFAKVDDRAMDATFEILADKGYLRREATETKGTEGLEVFVYPATNYYVTEKGKPFFFQDGRFINLCYGTREVVEVTDFTEPQQILTYMASTVNYTSVMAGVEEWATDERLLEELPEMQSAILDETAREDSADMVLTDNGWVHYIPKW